MHATNTSTKNGLPCFPFKLVFAVQANSMNKVMLAMYKTKVDLFSLAMDPLYTATGAKVRFDPGKYCPSKGWNRNNEGKGGGFDLILELQLSSIAHGQCCLVSNGGGKKSGGHPRNLFCSHFRCHDDSKCSQAKKVSKSSPSSAIASAPLRTTTPHGDQNNSRGKKGKEMIHAHP